MDRRRRVNLSTEVKAQNLRYLVAGEQDLWNNRGRTLFVRMEALAAGASEQ